MVGLTCYFRLFLAHPLHPFGVEVDGDLFAHDDDGRVSGDRLDRTATRK
jgi:hypothetical protein